MNDTVKSIKAEIRRGYERIEEIMKSCDHDWQPSTPEHPDASTPVCAKCDGTKHGWWCAASPTKECDYEHPNRQTNYDSCRYCHQPDERK